MAVVIPVPITNRAGETILPVERKEQNGTIVVVCQYVNNRVQHAGTQEKVKPPAQAWLEATACKCQREQNQQHRRGMQEVVERDPVGVVKIQIVKQVVENTLVFPAQIVAKVVDASEGKEVQWNIWRD